MALTDETVTSATHEAVFLDVLGRAVEAVGTTAPYVALGGLASAVHGRPRWTHDIDLLVRPEDAVPSLGALEAAGFATDRLDDAWIYKATRDDVVVDLIFKASGGMYLDEPMIERAVAAEFRGVEIQVMPPEDLVVCKAIAHDEETPRHWYDALAVIARCDLDWDHLVERAALGPRRVLSLLLYAVSNDLAVPRPAIESLWAGLVEA